MVKNCLQCVHFVKRFTNQYSKCGFIMNVDSQYYCDKLKIQIFLKNSDEKKNENKMIPSKCENGKYFKELPHHIIWKEV